MNYHSGSCLCGAVSYELLGIFSRSFMPLHPLSKGHRIGSRG